MYVLHNAVMILISIMERMRYMFVVSLILTLLPCMYCCTATCTFSRSILPTVKNDKNMSSTGIRVKGYSKACILYYKNASSTFHMSLLTSGDVEINPGPSFSVSATKDQYKTCI